jgi:hypothetical protein
MTFILARKPGAVRQVGAFNEFAGIIMLAWKCSLPAVAALTLRGDLTGDLTKNP